MCVHVTILENTKYPSCLPPVPGHPLRRKKMNKQAQPEFETADTIGCVDYRTPNDKIINTWSMMLDLDRSIRPPSGSIYM